MRKEAICLPPDPSQTGGCANPLEQRGHPGRPSLFGRHQGKTRTQGEELFQAKAARDFEWLDPDDAFLATVDAAGGECEVDLYFENGRWRGECTCDANLECEHCYAAIASVLAANRRALSTPARAAAPIPEGATGSSFADDIAARLGRALDRGEIRICRAIEDLRERHPMGPIAENQLHFLLGGQSNWSWERHTIWPRQPASAWEAWLYLAEFLKQKRKTLPTFLAPLTTDADIEALMKPWQREKEVAEWTGWLQERLRPGPPATVDQTPLDLRVVFLRDGLQVETFYPGDDAWKPVKKGRWQELNKTHSGHDLPMKDESLLIWSALHTGWGDEPLIRYGSHQSQKIARKLLQSTLLRDRVLTAAGQPFQRPEVKIRWALRPAAEDHDTYTLQLELEGGARLPPALVVLPGEPVLYVTADAVYEAPAFAETIKRHTNKLVIPAAALESAVGVAVLDRARVPLPPRLTDRVTIRRPEVILQCHLRDDPAGGEVLDLRLLARWGVESADEPFTSLGWEGASEPLPEQAEGQRIVHWDRASLPDGHALLEGLGVHWEDATASWEWKVGRKFPQQFGDWLDRVPSHVRLELDPLLATLKAAPLSASVKLDVEPAGTDWFDLRIALDLPDVEFTPEELEALLGAKGGWVRLGDKGWRKLSLHLSEEEDAALADLGLSTTDLTSAEPQRLHALQLGAQKASRLLPETRVEELRLRAQELQAGVKPPVPGVVSAELRPYQIDGFHYLAYLSQNNFGGLLADDMGLGKTLQTLTWLCWLRSAQDFAGNQSLVVCPKSVMDNWSAEALRFLTNGLRVRLWRSTDKGKVLDAVRACDLLVVNYAQLRGLANDLCSVNWHVVILDEAQAIKNPESQTARAACALGAQYRLALTGTPIENRLLDLWSIMNFAMPGILGPRARFARTYDQKEDPLARRRLAGRVRPFVLRRTKEQVAKDLPARIEEDIFCEMEGKQATLYRAELKRARQALLNLKTAKEFEKARFNILTSLLRLRQICCHPQLVDAGATEASSAKVDGLVDLLEPLLEEGRKVLVFSQFVGVLEILQKELNAREWKHFILTGQTENRGALIEDFQKSEGASVFLLSLKASGFGLNLTAASYVVLFDPWWNPAVENQAIDRAHRIGQKDTVFAYRLLVKGSIEEKIRTLQLQKRALADDVLGEEAFAQALTLEDLRSLLEDPD